MREELEGAGKVKAGERHVRVKKIYQGDGVIWLKAVDFMCSDRVRDSNINGGANTMLTS
jgi:hypothetical protein